MVLLSESTTILNRAYWARRRVVLNFSHRSTRSEKLDSAEIFLSFGQDIWINKFKQGKKICQNGKKWLHSQKKPWNDFGYLNADRKAIRVLTVIVSVINWKLPVSRFVFVDMAVRKNGNVRGIGNQNWDSFFDFLVTIVFYISPILKFFMVPFSFLFVNFDTGGTLR